jgi:hypothetical protein
VKIWFALAMAACGAAPSGQPAIRFLHTFGADETELFNATMAERGIAVESQLVPFARGQQMIGEVLHAGNSCPDLIRIDATWLPALETADLLLPAPVSLAKLDWTPEAAALAGSHAVPQTVDGLIVVRDASSPEPVSPRVEDLIAAARAARTQSRPYPLGLRVDGYWLLPWLRAEGGELAPAGIVGDGAVHALDKFAALFGDVSPPPPPPGSEAPEELRRYSEHEIAYWVTGPWQLAALREREFVAVSAIARAPRGGQLLVVPRCAKHPDDGWRLAAELTDVAVEQRFAEAFATVPTRVAALDGTSALVKSVYAALRSAEPLPRVPITPLLFDDLNPALAAVVGRDATPVEAIEGVRRGWARLQRSLP